ncbi:hypothetical protein [Halogeometricum limi]|uniref:Uncharacterized protein n=1 Tax=Halogeometricum limi TaxID=555875 RepID=A0A1I6IJH9_9EURY|nr:hypothetical protein [Halogeometricum limi]SFR66882.1 hypothetical protein SAMN04488124_3296 [Halogeometricum limi]
MSVDDVGPSVIELERGESRVFRTSEDDLSNTLVVPNGGSVRIVVDSGGRWTNVGIERGVNARAGGVGHVFAVMVPKGERFVLDGFYTGGTTSGGSNDAGGHAFAFTAIDHAGRATFRNGFVTDWYQPFYCSNSGNPPHRNDRHAGYGGDVHLQNVYAEKFAHTAFRLGTDGSTCVDCVAAKPYTKAGPARSGWAFFNKPRYERLQFATRITSGSRHGRARPHLVDCRGVGGRMAPKDYTGDPPKEGADLRVPRGVPTSARAAARGRRK